MCKRERKTIRALKRGEVVDLDGILLIMDAGTLQPGDLYIAERNTGPKLLTVEEINHNTKVVFPTTIDYSFDLWECVKVREATAEETKP